MNKTPAKVGRPSPYRDTFPEQTFRLALLGLTDAELAKFYEVDESTINEWKKVHPAFSQSIARGRADADSRVAEKLYRRALGYSHDSVKIFMPAGAEEPVYAPYTEHYPPDTQAASMWLRNRQPGRWKDVQDHNVTAAITLDVLITQSLAGRTIEHEPAAPQQIEGAGESGETPDVDGAARE